MDLKEISHGVNQQTHWYYCTKKIPLIRFVENILKLGSAPLSIIDIGAGTGYFSQVLSEHFGERISKIVLVDINYSEQEVIQSKNERIKKVRFFSGEITNSLIIMMDILEHIKDDTAFLNELVSKTKGVNYFFVTVPAFMSLWSYHDEYLLHYRRYSLNSISEVVKKNRINIISKYYIYFSLFPYAVLFRKYFLRKDNAQNDMRAFPFFINKLLRFFFSFEMLFRKLNRIAGLSCCIEGKIVQR